MYSSKRIFLILSLCYNIISIAQKPEIVITTGHAELITNIDVSQNGKLIASHGPDQIIKIWEVASGKELTTINNKTKDATSEQRINGMKFSKNNKSLLTLDEDGNIRLWDISNGNLIHSFKGTAGIGFNTVDIIGNMIAFADENYSIVSKNINSGKEQKISGVMSMTLSINPANTQQIAFFSLDMKLSLYDIEKEKKIMEFPGINNQVMLLEISNDGKQIATILPDNTLKIWSMDSGKELFNHKFKTHVSDLKFHPITNQIITLSPNPSNQIENLITIRSPQTFKVVKEIKLKKPFTSKLAIGGAKGEFLVINSSGTIANRTIYTIEILDWQTGNLVSTLQSKSKNSLQLRSGNETPIVATMGNDLKLRIWNIENQKLEKVYPYAQKICTSGDGKKLGVFGLGLKKHTGMAINIIDMNSLEVISEIPVTLPLLTGFSFSDNNTVLGAGMDGKITAWNIDKGKVVKTFSNGFTGMQYIASDKDFKYVASSATGQVGIRVIDATKNSLHKNITEAHKLMGASDIKFSPDGKYLASGSFDKKVSLWQTGTWNHYKDLTDNIGPVSSVAFNSDGSLIASSSRGSTVGKTDYAVHVWKTESGQNLCTLLGHTKNVNDVAFYDKGKLIFSGADDGMFKIWDSEKCKEIASCISVGDSDYLIVTPDYYYTGSKGAMEGVGFKVKGKTELYPFEQFDLRLNRPDIIAERIGLASNEMIDAYKRAYLKRLTKMDFTQEMLGDDFHLPEVEILNSDNIPLTTKDKNLKITIKASDSQNELDRINVWINNIPIYGIKGMSLRDKNIKVFSKRIELKLSKGRNKIQISVHNQKGGESLKITREIIYEAPNSKNKLFIVAIGVSDYDNDDFDLTYASKDANDLVNYMKTQTSKYSEIEILSYLDKEATTKNILSAKEKLMQSDVDDEVVLFVAGHGLLDENMDYYFGTPNVNFRNPSENGLPYEQLESLIDGIPARKKLMLIDACHSGEIDKDETMVDASAGTGVIERGADKAEQGEVVFRGMKKYTKKKSELGLKNSFELMKELFSDLRRGSGAMVISSAGGVEFAFESDSWKNGVFTYSLLEGLKSKKADTNKDNHINVSELREYVMKRVMELTNGQQHPTSRRENLEFDFRVW